MKTSLTLVSKLVPYPYALFKDNACIFESEIDDAYSLNSLMKHVGSQATVDTIAVKYFRGFLFFSIKVPHQTTDYTLITVLREKKIKTWSDDDWQAFYTLLQTAAYLISVEQHFPIQIISDEPDTDKRPNFSNHTFINHDINTDFQDNYQLELSLIALLKKGNLQAIKPLLRKLVSINQSKLSDDPLTNKKYKLVAFLTILTRTSIKQGCSANLAYRLSDSLIQSLDKLTKQEDIPLFTDNMLIEFSNLNSSMPNNYTSELVNSAIVFIHANLYERLSNHEIANCLSVHPAYLSSLFKKVTGRSLKYYIISEKIAESQYLLANTDFPFSVISERLHFSNQSHFCKLFKAHTSYTPREFRLGF